MSSLTLAQLRSFSRGRICPRAIASGSSLYVGRSVEMMRSCGKGERGVGVC